MNIFEMVRKFHKAFGQPVLDKPTVPNEDRVRLRLRLITEEFLEMLEDHGLGEYEEFEEAKSLLHGLVEGFDPVDDRVNIVGVADAIIDQVYVLLGMCHEYGIPFFEVFQEVHRSNMAKLGTDGKPMYNFFGKVIKPANWLPPNIRKVLGIETQ